MSQAASPRKLRLALVGAGGMGRVWSEKISAEAGAELAALVDPLIGSERQSEWLAEYPHVAKYTSLDAAAAVARLDAVVVTAFTIAHADIIRNALNLGLHVLVEKPFTVTMQEATEMVALAEAKQRRLMVSQNYRFYPGALAIREWVRDGRFGAIRSVFSGFWCDWPGKPYQHGMQHVMGLEMACHHFDLCRAMFDADPVGGYVREWQPAGSQYAGGGAMEALFDMRGAQTDFPFTYSGSLVGKAPRTPWGGIWRLEFDRQTVVVDTIEERYGVYRAHEAGYEFLCSFDGENMAFDKPLAHFVECIREEREPWCSGRDNLGTMRMALGAEFFGKP